MAASKLNKSFFILHWKWIIPATFIIFSLTCFFLMTGDAAFRYGAVYLQPYLVHNALTKANSNKEVKKMLGELQSHDFFKLLEGEVNYSNNHNNIAVTVGIRGTNAKGKLDIWAHKKNNNWVYDSIFVRIKKPKKKRITILKKHGD